MKDTRGANDAQPGASSPPKAGGGLKRVGAWARIHWKELLAIGLAAIPAAFLLFHKGTQQAATSALSYPASLFGSGGSGDTSTSAGSSSDTSGAGGSPSPPPPSPQPLLTQHEREWLKAHPGYDLAAMARQARRQKKPKPFSHGTTDVPPGSHPRILTSVHGSTGVKVAAPKKGKVKGK